MMDMNYIKETSYKMYVYLYINSSWLYVWYCNIYAKLVRVWLNNSKIVIIKYIL